MNEKMAIEHTLQTERRILQRQELLKRLWKLNQAERKATQARQKVHELTHPR
jgi:hypothetical protein